MKSDAIVQELIAAASEVKYKSQRLKDALRAAENVPTRASFSDKDLLLEAAKALDDGADGYAHPSQLADRLRSAASTVFVAIGEVVGHELPGRAFVRWFDNGLRPIGMKVYSATSNGRPLSSKQQSDIRGEQK